MANRPRYQVLELRDNGLPVYVAMQRAGQPLAARAWECRDLVDNPLTRWLRTLDAPPEAHILLGSGVQLTRRTAWTLVQFRRNEIARMAATWPNPPDFALWLPMHRGGVGNPRPVCREKDGAVERFPSIDDAAQALRTSHDDIVERVETGLDAGGAFWLDDA